MERQIGQVRIGRRIYDRGGKYVDPTYPGFTQIICLTKSTAYGSLGPYELRDEKGRVMENIYQASKIYANIPAACESRSRYDKTIIWQYPAEKHAIKNGDNLEVLPAYMRWRKSLMQAKEAIRYPVGFNHRHQCLGAFAEDDEGKIIPELLGYIDGRKKIYVPLYTKLVRDKPQFVELKQRILRGESVNLVEVDGPHQESLEYYREKYGVEDNFIEGDTILATPANLKLLLNDPKHPFGHGYVLAAALLEIDLLET